MYTIGMPEIFYSVRDTRDVIQYTGYQRSSTVYGRPEIFFIVRDARDPIEYTGYQRPSIV